ncbi:MAG: hypothetical protein CALGDGBN_00564 [Pseudomonadales bacterium]|nr:hypothetical protein [Pseudomonadales bacterium]
MQTQDSDRIAPPASGARRQRRAIALALLAGVLLGAAVLLLGERWLHAPAPAPLPGVTQNAAAPSPGTAPATAAPAPAGGATPAIEVSPIAAGASAAEPLPPLADSDDEVRRGLAGLLPAALHPSLAPANLLARAAALTDSFARGRLLRDKLPLPAAPGKPVVVERDGHLYLDPANHARYDTLVAAIGTIDTAALARWYLRYEPLLQQAYEELGNGDARLRAALLAGIDTMLAAPAAPVEIALVQPAVFYKFADPALEALPPTQKLLLRIGPHNRAILTRQLTSFKEGVKMGSESN